MWQMLLATLRRQRGNTLLASGGFFLAACTLILLTATTQGTVVQANQIISQNWRPAYDLVVLPPQEQIPAGKAVPADAIAGYGGGISNLQYQQIQQIPGVAIAAPIAYLGYVQLPRVDIAFEPNPLPQGYYRVDWKLSESNGQRTTVKQQESMMYYVYSCDEYDSASFRQELDNLSSAMAKQNISQASGCGVNGGFIPTPFDGIDTGPFLLAAIDPAAENQLMHLGQHITTGRMFNEQDTIQLDRDFQPPQPIYQVPIMLQQQLPGKISLHATFTQVTTQHISLSQVLKRGGYSYLAHLPGQQTLFSSDVPTVQSSLSAIYKTGYIPSLYWDGHSWQIIPYYGSSINLKFLNRPSGLTYRQAAPPAGFHGSAYTLIPAQKQQGQEVSFRTLTPVSVANKSNTYEFQFIGQFNSEKLSAQFSNPLNWLPETTYVSAPNQLLYNAQGQPVKPTNLLPTTNPSGYMLQPPIALTTLSAAQSILGANKNIISVIRVRVAGVSAANEASWNHVAQVAQQIRQRTGLRVVVTLGSSPQPTLVYVPGIKAGQNGATQTIAPLGWVQDSWIYIGAAVLYLAQLGTTRLLFLGAILLVCLGYLIVTFSALATTQRREFAVLSALGWRPWQPVRMFLGQALLLALGGGIIGVGAALLIATLVGAAPIWLVVIWTLPAILALGLLSVLYPLWQIWHIRPAEALRAGTSMTGGSMAAFGLRLSLLLPPLVALSLSNLTRLGVRVLIAIGSIFFSALLLTIMFSGLLSFRQTLQGTLLGNYVLFETQIPQIAGPSSPCC